MSKESRLKKIEKRVGIGVREDGIAQWAVEHAEKAAEWENYNRPNHKKWLNAIEPWIGKREMSERRFKTEEDILNFARELSEKYTSHEDYKNNPPPPDPKTIGKLEALIKEFGSRKH